MVFLGKNRTDTERHYTIFRVNFSVIPTERFKEVAKTYLEKTNR